MLKDYKWLLQSLKPMAVIGLTIAVIISLFAVSIPQLLEVFELRSETFELRDRINILASKVSALREMDNQGLEERFLVVLEVLPEDFDVSHIISTLRQVADEVSVQVGNVEAVVKEPGLSSSGSSVGIVKTQQVSLTITGEQSVLVNFLDEINNVRPILKVTELAVSVSKNEEAEMRIVIESYASVVPKFEDRRELSDDISEIILEPEDERLYEELKLRRKYEFVPAEGEDFGRINPFNL